MKLFNLLQSITIQICINDSIATGFLYPTSTEEIFSYLITCKHVICSHEKCKVECSEKCLGYAIPSDIQLSFNNIFYKECVVEIIPSLQYDFAILKLDLPLLKEIEIDTSKFSLIDKIVYSENCVFKGFPKKIDFPYFNEKSHLFNAQINDINNHNSTFEVKTDISINGIGEVGGLSGSGVFSIDNSLNKCYLFGIIIEYKEFNTFKCLHITKPLLEIFNRGNLKKLGLNISKIGAAKKTEDQVFLSSLNESKKLILTQKLKSLNQNLISYLEQLSSIEERIATINSANILTKNHLIQQKKEVQKEIEKMESELIYLKNQLDNNN